VYYVQFFRRRPGIPLSDLYEVARNFEEWSRREPEDELVGVLARTWRLGPHEHLLVWRCRDLARLDEWDVSFRSHGDIEDPVLDATDTYASGFYAEVGQPAEPLDRGYFYFESYAPQDAVTQSYAARAESAGARVALLGERIGLLGPPPGGMALVSVPRLSVVEVLQRDIPDYVESAGLYTPLGNEIL
jgi:hypothetical protein